MKLPQGNGASWKNRIVGHGEEPPDQLLAHPKNFRVHPAMQQSALAGSLDGLGWIQEVIVNKRTGHMIDGHLRVALAMRSGAETIPVAYVDLDEAEEAQALLSLDPIAAMASTDKDNLDALLRDVQTDDERVMEYLAELAKDNGLDYGQPPQGDAEPEIDRAEELRVKWGVELGQLWRIGDHRLICGDCTDKAVVDRVMGGEKADICFTSPPYAAQREYKIGDFDWLGLMIGMSERSIEVTKDDGSILVNLGLVHIDGRVYRYWDEWIDWMEDNDQPLYGWYVWDKLSGLMGDWRGRLAPAHEWIFHFAKQPRRANKTADTKYKENGVTHYKKDKVGLRGKDGKMNGFTSAGRQVNSTKVIDSVIRCQPQRGGVDGHPAPFSVAFASTLIEVYASTGMICYEPFAGSGTTLVACQNLARKCRAIEISPAYCAVILERIATAFPGIEIAKVD